MVREWRAPRWRRYTGRPFESPKRERAGEATGRDFDRVFRELDCRRAFISVSLGAVCAANPSPCPRPRIIPVGGGGAPLGSRFCFSHTVRRDRALAVVNSPNVGRPPAFSCASTTSKLLVVRCNNSSSTSHFSTCLCMKIFSLYRYPKGRGYSGQPHNLHGDRLIVFSYAY